VIVLAAACLITLHDPAGRELTVERAHIALVQPAEEVKHHLAPGTNAVIYLQGKNFGVRETREQVKDMMEDCDLSD
jgi:hypothetical protein